MVKHIVQFKFRADVSQQDREKAAAQFKKGIEALPQTIHCIRQIEVGININPKETWHVCLVSVFDNLQDVAAYSQHPSHQAVAKALMQYVEQRACVDYKV